MVKVSGVLARMTRSVGTWCGGPNSSAGDTPPAFAELQLSDKQLVRKVAELQRHGFFTIPMAPATQAYLRQSSAAGPWRAERGFDRMYLQGGEGVETVRGLAQRIASALGDDAPALDAHEFELRRPGAATANLWHRDRSPNKLVVLATLCGATTEYVLPAVVDEKFERGPTVLFGLQPRDDVLESRDIKQLPPRTFAVFAARGLRATGVPHLVHRAPELEPIANFAAKMPREIFLARWKAPEPGSEDD